MLFSSAAAEFPAASEWLNIDRPLSMKALEGHIVVLDFWTYCCINCIHMLPDIKMLEEDYAGRPVVFIGVHSAKFENENDVNNIRSAVQRYEIAHPVVVDRDHRIWNAYKVTAWPTIVIIGPDGKIAYKRSGEGQLQDIDAMITALLKRKDVVGEKIPIAIAPKVTKGVLSFPGKIDYRDGVLAIADSNHHRILVAELAGATAKVIHEIGSTTEGMMDGSFANAMFSRPQGVAIGKDCIYVADTENHAIRLIDLKTKAVETVAGTGEQSKGEPRKGKLNSPWDVLFRDGKLYIAMAGSHQIWEMDAGTRRLAAYAGTSAENIIDGPRHSAFLAQPSGLATDGEFLYFVDSEVSALRRVRFSSGAVETLIGKGLFVFGHADGTFGNALLQHPLGVDYANAKVYVADTYNHAIREVDLKNRTVSTLIGRKPSNVCTVAGSECDSLPLYEPNDVVALGDALLIADTNNHLIRLFRDGTLTDVEIVF
ncbi:MAG: redoxin domain-containing protein [Candidatus Aenigmarchaeota archaeon]|nr:redoxin domain-containing protein [Candidatus Aenigmarchaeota archaeon]